MEINNRDMYRDGSLRCVHKAPLTVVDVVIIMHSQERWIIVSRAHLNNDLPSPIQNAALSRNLCVLLELM